MHDYSVDSSITEKIWNGNINIIIRNKLQIEDQSEPYDEIFLVQVSRLSYLPLYYETILEYFYHGPRRNNNPVWLEYQGVPLKWNVPIGVLYDRWYSIESFRSKKHLWLLDLKGGESFPDDKLICYKRSLKNNIISYEESVRDVVTHQTKQSCFVLNGNARRIMNLSQEDSVRLWESIKNRLLGTYLKISEKIYPQAAEIYRVPIRILFTGSESCIQSPIHPYKSDKTTKTMVEVLKECVPFLVSDDDTVLSTLIIQGIPVQDLSELSIVHIWSLFKHLDNFLYIVSAYNDS